jgi:hypothetical protein
MQPNTLETQLQPAPHRTAGSVFILADDLTGACDSGAAFLATGRSVRVMLDDPDSDLTSLLDGRTETVLAFATEIRNLTQDQAAELVARTTMLLRSAPNGHIFSLRRPWLRCMLRVPRLRWLHPHFLRQAAPFTTASSTFATQPHRIRKSRCGIYLRALTRRKSKSCPQEPSLP